MAGINGGVGVIGMASLDSKSHTEEKNIRDRFPTSIPDQIRSESESL